MAIFPEGPTGFKSFMTTPKLTGKVLVYLELPFEHTGKPARPDNLKLASIARYPFTDISHIYCIYGSTMECWVGTTAVSPFLILPGWWLISLEYWVTGPNKNITSTNESHICSGKRAMHILDKDEAIPCRGKDA